MKKIKAENFWLHLMHKSSARKQGCSGLCRECKLQRAGIELHEKKESVSEIVNNRS